MKPACLGILLLVAGCREPSHGRDPALDASPSSSIATDAAGSVGGTLVAPDAGDGLDGGGRIFVGHLVRPIQQIASDGSEDICAVDAEGRVGCYGYPIDYRRFAWPTFSFGPVAEVTVQNQTVCARSREGQAECVWLYGYGKPEIAVVHRWKVPVDGIREIALGQTTFCARLEDSSVRCWSLGADARSGVATQHFADPHEPSYSIEGFQHPLQIISKPCALEENGHVDCADVDTATPVTETRVAKRVSGLDDVVGISGQFSTACARRKDGSVWCWGSNDSFKLAHERPGVFPQPRRIPGVTDAIQVQVGKGNVCALDREGAVFCWGHGSTGELLGQGNCKEIPSRYKDVRECAVSTPEHIQGIPPAQQIAVGDVHVCILGQDGDVYCWGGSVLRSDDINVRVWKVPW